MERFYKFNYYLLLLIVATYILPTVSGLPYTPAAGFYVPIWLVFLLFTCPNIFFSKGFLLAYLFLILHLLYVTLSFYPSTRNNTRLLLDEVLPLMFSFSIIEYYLRVGRVHEFKNLINLAFYGTILTTLTSGIALLFFPSAARDLAGGLVGDEEQASFFALVGIGGFYFYIFLAAGSCVYLYVILNIKNNRKAKLFFITLYILSLSTVILSQYAASFALFFVGTILVLLNHWRKRFVTIIFIILMSSFAFLGRSQIASSMRDIAAVIDLPNLSPRIINMAGVIEGSTDAMSEEETVYKDDYDELINISMNSFNENIATGGGIIGDHTFWYDTLGNYGLLGLIPWLFVFYYLIASRIRLFNKELRPIFLICILLLIYIGFHKPLRSFASIPYFAFFLPAILFKVQTYFKN